MSLRVVPVLLLTALAASAWDPPARIDADELLENMRAAYGSLDTYAHRGTERTDLPKNVPFASSASLPVRAFRLWFDRERGFRFEFRMRQELGLGMKVSYEHVALWGDADEVRLWRGHGKPRTYDDLEKAIDDADDLGGRSAGIVLQPLFGLERTEPGTPDEPQADTIDGHSCWRVTWSGEFANGSTWSRTLWIDAASHLLRGVDWTTTDADGDPGLGSHLRIVPEPGARISAADLEFDPEAAGGVLGFGRDAEWDFAFEKKGGGGTLDLPPWLPWVLLGTGLGLAVLFVVILRGSARRHAAARRDAREERDRPSS